MEALAAPSTLRHFYVWQRDEAADMVSQHNSMLPTVDPAKLPFF